MSDVYLLETSITGPLHLPNHKHHAAAKRFLERLSTDGDSVMLSTIALAEHEYGFAMAEAVGKPVSRELIELRRQFYASFEKLDFDAHTIEPYAILRAELFNRYATRKGVKQKLKEKRPEELRASGVELGIEEKDLMIAATAIQYNVILATMDIGPGMSAIIEAAEMAAKRGLPIKLRWYAVPNTD